MRIAAFYFALFAAVGVLLPYTAIFYRSLGFNGSDMALLASVGPLLSIVVPPAWGFAADKLQRTSLFLKIAAFGSAATLAGLLFAHSLPAVILILIAYGSFSSSLTPLADSLAAVEAKRIGTDYARLRLFGSIGFILLSFTFGSLLSKGAKGSDVILFGSCLLLVSALVSLLLKADKANFAPPTFCELKAVLARPAFLLFLLAAMVHWAASSVYNLLFALYLRDLNIPSERIGLGISLAVVAEVLAMWGFRRLNAKFSLILLMLVGFLAGAVRWILVAILKSGPLLAAVQLLHGLSFGVFFIAAVAFIDVSVPGSLRATGRTLFASVVFGIGGVIGNAIGGCFYDIGGGSLSFFLAAALDLIAPLFLFGVYIFEKRDARN
jgi:PPP family 3-phenylpropionic acid transporter